MVPSARSQDLFRRKPRPLDVSLYTSARTFFQGLAPGASCKKSEPISTKTLSFRRASNGTRTSLGYPRPYPHRGTGADLQSALSRNGFVAVLTPLAIPDFGRLLPAGACGLRVAYRPCSPNNLPRRSRDTRVHPRTGLRLKDRQCPLIPDGYGRVKRVW